MSVNEHLIVCVQLFHISSTAACVHTDMQTYTLAYTHTRTHGHTDPVTLVGAMMNEHKDRDDLLFYLFKLSDDLSVPAAEKDLFTYLCFFFFFFFKAEKQTERQKG